MANSVSKIAQNQRKSFKNYQKLPAELRMMIVDEMKPVDRCRFSQCSYLSSMEAKRSRNYMYSLEFFCFDRYDIRIKVTFDEDSKCGFHLMFLQTSDGKLMKYTNFQGRELWRTELPSSTDLVQFSAEYFKNNLLRDYQNIIKQLRIENFLENRLQNFDFGFENLKNLEWLLMGFNSSILQIISKLRKPLKTLIVYGKENNRELENYEISNISERICLPDRKLNYEQFIRLSATDVTLHIGGLTEEDICEIIKSWQNQETGGKAIYYKWYLNGSNFNISKLMGLLEEDDSDTDEDALMTIKHGFEEGKRARLIQEVMSLVFEA